MSADKDLSLEDIIADLDSDSPTVDTTDSLQKYLSQIVEYDIANNTVTALDEAIYMIAQHIHESLQENQSDYGFNYDFARQLLRAPLQVLEVIHIQHDEDFAVVSAHMELDEAYITFDEFAPMPATLIFNRLLRISYDSIASDFGLTNSSLTEFVQAFIAAAFTGNDEAQETVDEWHGELVIDAAGIDEGPRDTENDVLRQYQLKTFCKRWNCGEEDPRRCYKKAALRLHPDRNREAAATAKFQELGNDFDDLCGQSAIDCALPCPDVSSHWLPEELKTGEDLSSSRDRRVDDDTASKEKWMSETTKGMTCQIPHDVRDAVYAKLEQIASHLGPFCIADPSIIRVYCTDTFDVLYVWCRQSDTMQTVASWMDVLSSYTCRQMNNDSY